MTKDIEWQRQISELTRRCDWYEQQFKLERAMRFEIKETFVQFVLAVLKQHKYISTTSVKILPECVRLRVEELLINSTK